MRTTIDKAGRVVIPKALRDAVGLAAGDVEISATGTGILIEPITGDGLMRRGDLLVIPAAGSATDDDLVQALRDAGQR